MRAAAAEPDEGGEVAVCLCLVLGAERRRRTERKGIGFKGLARELVGRQCCSRLMKQGSGSVRM